MRPQKFSPRADYRKQEGQRAKDSVSLAEKFHELKSLTVELAYFTSDGVARNREIKYTVNPERARSVFRFDCLNEECVRGDFDLSEAVALAVAGRQTKIAAEMCCQGWLSKTTIDQIRCRNILRYKLNIEYGTRPVKEPVPV